MRALISVSDKDGVVEFAKDLANLGLSEIYFNEFAKIIRSED